MNLTEINQELDNFINYLNTKIDIKVNDPERWVNSNSKHNLPSFEYYKEHCINDKGGKYDFTQRRYSTYSETLMPINKVDYQTRSIKNTRISRKVLYSMWMGTCFNFKEQLSIN